nr:TIR domain-containing protein [Cohnella sp. REN36]
MNRDRSPLYQLYFSRTWSHEEAYRELRTLLGGREGFRFAGTPPSADESLSATGRERELYEAIRRRMKHCHAVLLLAGVYPAYSNWINKEIIACKEEVNKPLIAIERFEPSMTSMIVRQNADAVVGWQADEIVNAIKRLARFG